MNVGLVDLFDPNWISGMHWNNAFNTRIWVNWSQLKLIDLSDSIESIELIEFIDAYERVDLFEFVDSIDVKWSQVN